MIRFKLGNKMREGRYWEEEQKKLCRLCGAEMKTWEHVWGRCRKWRKGQGSWQEALRWVLGKEGENEWWMRDVGSKRRGEGKGIGGKQRGRGVGSAAERRKKEGERKYTSE